MRDPARVLVVLGAVVAVVASPLPWLVKVGNPPPEMETGWTGLFDGFLIAVVAVAVSWLVLNREAARASTRLVRWLPPLLGAVAVMLGVSAIRNMENQIEIWSMQAATGEYQPWFFVCLGGVAMIALGTLILGVRLVREPRRASTGSPSGSISRATIATVVGGTVGCVLGVIAAIALVLSLDIDPFALSLPLMLGTFVGGIVGANLGARLARFMTAPGSSA